MAWVGSLLVRPEGFAPPTARAPAFQPGVISYGACCPIRFAQYGKITKITKKKIVRSLQRRTKACPQTNLGTKLTSYFSLPSVKKSSVFVSFVIFPYCHLRFYEREELGLRLYRFLRFRFRMCLLL